MKIGVYVGSFNPPHDGHKHVAEFLIKKRIVDEVWLLPTPDYWDKKFDVALEDRINMLRFLETESIKVDIIHNNYPYTFEVFRSLKEDNPKNDYYLIIGSDNLEKLHEWKNIEELLENKVIVLKRKTIVKNPYLKKYEDNFIYVEDFDYIDISSSRIRQGERKNLDSRIKEYISKHHLYE